MSVFLVPYGTSRRLSRFVPRYPVSWNRILLMS